MVFPASLFCPLKTKRPARAGTRAGLSRIRRRWGPSEGQRHTEGETVEVTDRLTGPDRVALAFSQRLGAEIVGRTDLAVVEADRPVAVDRVQEHERFPAE